MKLYKLMSHEGDQPEELGWVEVPDDGGPPVFSDDATRDLLQAAAIDAGGRVPLEETERFLAAAQADLASSSFVRLEESEM